MTLTHCPGCGQVAEFVRRFVLDSTAGPVEHAQVRCVARHWFALPTALLDQAVNADPDGPPGQRGCSTRSGAGDVDQ
jgi:hypothetical protein